MREVNRSLVLDLVKAGGRVSRASIARSTMLAKPTVSAIVDELIVDGLIVEIGVGATAGGRPPILLQYNARSHLVVGVHIGARRTSVAVGDATGVELARGEVPTAAGEPAGTLGVVAGMVTDLLAGLRPVVVAPVAAIGVVLPGLTDFHTGVCMLAPNLGWRDVAIGDVLAERLGAPVYVHNAGQAAAVAENLEGVGAGVGDLALLYAGTGLSAGVLTGGRVFHGVGGTAGEIGHCAVPGNKLPCTCGKVGCLETIASGWALVRVVQQAIADGRPSTLGGRSEIDGRDIATAAEAGDRVAAEAIAEQGATWSRPRRQRVHRPWWCSAGGSARSVNRCWGRCGPPRASTGSGRRCAAWRSSAPGSGECTPRALYRPALRTYYRIVFRPNGLAFARHGAAPRVFPRLAATSSPLRPVEQRRSGDGVLGR
jgi:predicted NBD/HSP70 family sugar kinase